MDHQAHGLDLSHPVYTHPRRAQFQLHETESPPHYAGHTSPLYPNGAGETYRLTKFENEKPSTPNPTLVSHEGFFTDIPGFENLAEGHSAKALGSLSLARQGRWFYWGYSIDPERMTQPAKDTFVNVLYWMNLQRDSETVTYVTDTRKNFEVFTWLGRDRDEPYLRGVQEHLPGSLVPELREVYVPSFEGADAFVAKYLPYLFAGKPGMPTDKKYGPLFAADADAMALKTPNNDRASLERWVALADGDACEDREHALRCLERYVHAEIAPKSGTWTEWYAKQKARICFIDSTGFWWQVDPTVRTREARAARAR
ncbi:MAG: hypothetical protein KDC95_19115 [Planctomycetes bacterium]|nr:hypothetical protein [Planctomycetota bacterium]